MIKNKKKSKTGFGYYSFSAVFDKSNLCNISDWTNSFEINKLFKWQRKEEDDF